MCLSNDAVLIYSGTHYSVKFMNKPFRKVFYSMMLFFPYKSSPAFVSKVSPKQSKGK